MIDKKFHPAALALTCALIGALGWQSAHAATPTCTIDAAHSRVTFGTHDTGLANRVVGADCATLDDAFADEHVNAVPVHRGGGPVREVL